MHTISGGFARRLKFFPDPVVVNVIKELFQDLYGSWRLTGYPILVFGTTTESGRVPPNLVSCFKHEVDFEVRLFLGSTSIE